MNKTGKLIAGLCVFGMAMPMAFADDDKRDKHEGQEYEVELTPLNNSGVYGEVEIKVKGNKLTVSIEALGLEPNKVHPQHIHGLDNPVRVSTCPGIEFDSDGDGLVSVTEGAAAFGPIVLPLVPFDLVDASGRLEYEASFTINPSSLQPLDKRTVVLHGMTVDGVYIPSLPIACGELRRD